MSVKSTDNPNVRFPPPTIFVVGFLAGVYLHRSIGHDEVPPDLANAAWNLGAAVVAGAVGLIAWAVVTFRRFRTTMLPMRPSTAMVPEGPYRFTRNPMYIGLTAIYTGITLMIGFLWPMAWLPGVLFALQRLVIDAEERYLERRFGDSYRAYKGSVRRWI